MFRVLIVASVIWVGYCAWRFWVSCELDSDVYGCRIFDAEGLKSFGTIEYRRIVAILICLPIVTFFIALPAYWWRNRPPPGPNGDPPERIGNGGKRFVRAQRHLSSCACSNFFSDGQST